MEAVAAEARAMAMAAVGRRADFVGSQGGVRGMSSELHAAGAILLYLVVCASLIALANRFLPVRREVIRKSYHIMICFCIVALVSWFDRWYAALITLGTYLAVAYVGIWALHRTGLLKSFSVDRERGVSEVLRQIGYFFLSVALSVTIFWGLLGPEWKFISLIGFVAWGFGDAAAALVGREFGRMRLKLPLFDNKKTVEGALAMFAVSAAAVFGVLSLMTAYSWAVRSVASLILAAAGTVVEASSHRGQDTLYLPLSLSFLAVPVLILLISMERWLL